MSSGPNASNAVRAWSWCSLRSGSLGGGREGGVPLVGRQAAEFGRGPRAGRRGEFSRSHRRSPRGDGGSVPARGRRRYPRADPPRRGWPVSAADPKTPPSCSPRRNGSGMAEPLRHRTRRLRHRRRRGGQNPARPRRPPRPRGPAGRSRCAASSSATRRKPRPVAFPPDILTTDLARRDPRPGGSRRRRTDRRDRPTREEGRARRARGRQARRHREQGAARRRRRRGVRGRPQGRAGGLLRGGGRRRRADHPRARREPRGEPGDGDPGHPQRHVELHPHGDGRARHELRRGARRGPAARATPRPTRRSTWTAATPPTSSRSWPRSRSASPRSRTRSSGSGIDSIDAMDIRFADELGYTIKLLAEAWAGRAATAERQSRTVALHVAPVLLRHTDLLAQVRGAYNAIAGARRRRRRDALPGAGGGT